MKTILCGIFSLLVAVQWTESSPAPDPLDTININLNLEEEPGSKTKTGSRDYAAMPKPAKTSSPRPWTKGEPERDDYQAMRQDYDDAPESDFGEICDKKCIEKAYERGVNMDERQGVRCCTIMKNAHFGDAYCCQTTIEGKCTTCIAK